MQTLDIYHIFMEMNPAPGTEIFCTLKKTKNDVMQVLSLYTQLIMIHNGMLLHTIRKYELELRTFQH